MAIYHFHVSSVCRSKGQNAVAAAAYISASKLVYRTIEKETGEEISITYDYSKKKGVIYRGIKVPKIAEKEEWVVDREKLWNKAEAKEKRKNSRIAEKITSALPKELTEEQNIELVEHYIDDYLVSTGMIVDYNIHYDNRNNPHVHFQTTTRDLEKTATGEIVFSDKKNRVWWRKDHLKEQRPYWANVVNHHLKSHGIFYEITDKSFKALGIDLIPTTHRGVGNYIEGSELQKQYDQIILENANMIHNNPELVFQRLSISKPVFTKEDIAIALSDALMIDIADEKKLEDKKLVAEFSKSLVAEQEVENKKDKKDKNKNRAISDIKNIEWLNKEYIQEFMKLYEMLLYSDKIELINPQDLQGRTIYGLKKNIDLERRFIGAVNVLNVQENHKLKIAETDIGKLNIKEEIGVAINEIGFKLQKNFNKKIGSKLGINLKLLNKRVGEFSEEQKKAIVGICNGKDISLLEGYPGSGKTFVLRELVQQYKKRGYQVIGTGPSSVSAQVLAKATGIEARNTSLLRKSILESQGKGFNLNLNSDYYLEEEYLKESLGYDKFLIFKKVKKSVLNSKTLLIIDEASMLELANMDYLVNEVLKSGSKLLVVGDNNQFPAVGKTGAFNKIKRICTINSLKTVKRHVNEDLALQDSYREATELLGRYKINEAISIYRKLGVFNISDTEQEAKNTLVADYMEQYIKHSIYLGKDDLASIRSVVVGTYTNGSVDYFNKEIREKLKLAGILQGKEYEFRVGNKRIAITNGEQIVFESNKLEYKGLGGVLNGEVGTVLNFNKPDKNGRGIIKVLVHKADGSKKIVHIDTGEDMYSVKFKHGYAVTGHKLQGETIDYMYVYYESNVGYEAFNVLMSRHKIDVSMYGSKEIMEATVYKRIDSDVESVKKSHEIEAYEIVEREEYDDNGNKKIVKERVEVPSWLVGLVIGVSRRVDNNFALDYKIQEILDDNLLVIKDYLESLSEVFSWHKKMQKWKEQQEQPVLLTDLSDKIKESGIKIDNPRSIIIDGYALIFANRQIDFEIREQEKENKLGSAYGVDIKEEVPKKTLEEVAAEKNSYIFSKIKGMEGENFKSLGREDQNIILLYYLSSASKDELFKIYDKLEEAKDAMSGHAKVICNSYNGWVDKKLEAEYRNLTKPLKEKSEELIEQRKEVRVLERIITEEAQVKKGNLSKKQLIKLEKDYENSKTILEEKENSQLIQEKAVEIIVTAIQKAAKGEDSELSKRKITMCDRIIQLNMNYETILKHAGLGKYRYYLKNIEEGKTINSSPAWQKLMKIAKDVGSGNAKRDIMLLTKYIAGTEKFIADNMQKVSIKEGEVIRNKLELTNIKQEMSKIEEYEGKLLPNYLGQIYKTSVKEVLNKWEKLKEQNKDKEVSKLIKKVKRYPSILSDLRGIGIGTLIPISKNRLSAIKRQDILTDQLIKYDANKKRLNEIEIIGGTAKYEKKIELLEQDIKLLQDKQPNKYEETFLDKLKLMQAKDGLNRESFKEYVIKKEVQDLIYEHYHSKNQKYTRLNNTNVKDNIETSNISNLEGFTSEKDRSIIEIQDYLNANNPNTVAITQKNIDDLKKFGRIQDIDNAYIQYNAYGAEVMNEFVYKACSKAIEEKITNDLQIMDDKWNGSLTKEKTLITVKDFKGIDYTNDYDYLAAIGLDERVMQYILKDSDLGKKIQNETQRVIHRQTINESEI